MYASNFNDSGMYVGACLQVCDITIDHAWMEYSALGYSGTNSGGAIIVKNSQFDNNQDGFDTNTQIAGDPPAPQNGACPGNAISPITHTHSCWVFMHNNVHDNNNPNVPQAGSASEGPIGTGMTISGGRNDTVMDNTFSNNGAWGVLFVPYPRQRHAQSRPDLHRHRRRPDSRRSAASTTPRATRCCTTRSRTTGSSATRPTPTSAQITAQRGTSRRTASAPTPPPTAARRRTSRQTQPTCGPLTTAANTGGPLLGQVLCDTGFGTCPAGAHYPTATGVVMHPLPTDLPSMPNPCEGVPANAWCVNGKLA